ncbi:MAG: hypothetical protein H7235_10935 [Bdellovibrionaceae bacterium]|nr:hypothetical protein [Pseudobdellovibrionaceae bacterium]
MVVILKSVHSLFFLVLFSLFTNSCSQVSKKDFDIRDAVTQGLIKAAKPQLAQLFANQAPILPPSQTRFPTITQLPGSEFKLNSKSKLPTTYDTNGNLILSAGDYVVPVTTYCMDHAGQSPSGHIYSLSRLSGSKAKIIREVNLKALPRFSSHDVQILSWSIQAGLKYEDMTEVSRKIIDTVIPEFKPELQQSFLSTFEKKWDQITNLSNGRVPSFENASEDVLNELGDTGKQINKMRQFRQRLKETGNDYKSLSQMIEVSETAKSINSKFSSAAWSQISDRIFARFITEGHYQQVGYVQIRVLPDLQKRKTSSATDSKVSFDLTSLVGDPMAAGIQPLSFSPIYGFGGLALESTTLVPPVALGIILGAIISKVVLPADEFYDVSKMLEGSKDSSIQKMIEEGTRALQEDHNSIEKPLKEAGIINGKTKDITTNDKNRTRQYLKPGGEDALQKDFDKLPGTNSKAQDGKDIKILPNGDTAINRPAVKDQLPTLEIQPSGNPNIDPKLRVKVRYE